MKRIPLVLILLSIFHFMEAQEIKSVSRKSAGFIEEFEVLTSDKKIKHGSYKKIDIKDRKVLAEGAYANDTKVGEWKYYSEGVLQQTYDFTTMALKYVKKPDFTFHVLVDGAVREVQLDTPPLYPGHTVMLNEELAKVIKYPHDALRMGVEGKVLLSIWISDKNEISEMKVIKGIMDKCDQEVVRAFSAIPAKWQAGTRDGKRVSSELLVVIHFELHANGMKTITVI